MKLKPTIVIYLALAAGFFGGCSKPENGEANSAPHLHVDQPPHGGTAIDLGKDEYHIEFVLDAANGKLQAFVLDGEMEEFIHSPTKSFEVTAQVGGREEKLDFAAIANRATGETVGDTSLFEAQADWLKTTTNFDAVLKEITVRGKIYSGIRFNFPKGGGEGGSSTSAPPTTVHGDKIKPQPAPTQTNPALPSAAMDVLSNAIAISATNLPPGKMGAPAPPRMPRNGPPTVGTVARQMMLPTNLPAEFISASGAKYRTISFAQLSSFPFKVDEDVDDASADPTAASAKTREQVPVAIQSLTEKQAAITGFMLPVQVNSGGLTTDFLLLKNQSACCYGVMPRINEWVIVRTTGKGVTPVMDVPVTALGTFHVGEMRENGHLVGIYLLDCDQIAGQNP